VWIVSSTVSCQAATATPAAASSTASYAALATMTASATPAAASATATTAAGGRGCQLH